MEAPEVENFGCADTFVKNGSVHLIYHTKTILHHVYNTKEGWVANSVGVSSGKTSLDGSININKSELTPLSFCCRGSEGYLFFFRLEDKFWKRYKLINGDKSIKIKGDPTCFVNHDLQYIIYKDVNGNLFECTWDMNKFDTTSKGLVVNKRELEILSPCHNNPKAFNTAYGSHIFYSDAKGDVYEVLYYLPKQYKSTCLSVDTMNHKKASLPVPCNSDITCTTRPQRNKPKLSIHIYYIGIDNELHEYYQRFGTPWKHIALSNYCNFVRNLKGNPKAVYLDSIHVFFLGIDKSLIEIYWNNRWRSVSLSNKIKKYFQVESSDFCVSITPKLHIFWIDSDGDINLLYWKSAWNHLQISKEEMKQDKTLTTSQTVKLTDSTKEVGGVPEPPKPPSLEIPKIKATPSVKTLKVAPKEVTIVDELHRKLLSDPKSKKLRVVVISDTHNHAHKVPMPPGDILIHAGDFTIKGTSEELEQFKNWVIEQQYEYKVVIAGNHEKFPEETAGRLKNHCTFLNDTAVSIHGINFYGTKWHTEYTKIPNNTHILITHKPPKGNGDIIFNGESRGSETLALEVKNRVKPLVHVFGHNHEGYGHTYDDNTTYINAATCVGGAKSVLRRQALVFDICLDYFKA